MDSTVNTARSFERFGIAVVKQRNAGAGAARNRGLHISKGEYIQFLDADDLLHPAKIEVQMEHLLRASSDEVAFASFWEFTDSVDHARRRELPLYHLSDPLDFLICSWNRGGFIQTAGWLIPRELIAKAGEWSERPVNPNDDGEFFTRVILAASRLHFCQDSIFYYRKPRHDSLASCRSRAALESLWWTLRSNVERLLQRENSPRAVEACRQLLVEFIIWAVPEFNDLAAEAETFLTSIGARKICQDDAPREGKFGWLSLIVGWRNARWLQHYVTRRKASGMNV